MALPVWRRIKRRSVSATSSVLITTVSTVDPIKVYFTPSEQEYLAFTRGYRSTAKVEAQARRVPLELILTDGTTYPYKGQIEFANIATPQNSRMGN